jgi:hypothetical protein
MSYLLDTCVISEFTKLEPDRYVIKWLNEHSEETLFLSSVTIGEVQKGISKLQGGRKKRKLQSWLDRDLMNRFRHRILPVDTVVAVFWGQIQAAAESTGQPLPVIDGLIAATAMANDMTVVTRNVSDIERSGAPIVDPWG